MHTELILIRHGETAWNRERRMQGQTDTPLSDIGRAQAEAVGQRLAQHPFAALYSSDLARAWDTAAAIARAHKNGHEIRREPALRERTFGVFEGLTYDEMAQHFPAEHARFALRDPDYAVPGGESPRQFFERSLACLESIAAAHAGRVRGGGHARPGAGYAVPRRARHAAGCQTRSPPAQCEPQYLSPRRRCMAGNYVGRCGASGRGRRHALRRTRGVTATRAHVSSYARE